jgi:hypothetical protein
MNYRAPKKSDFIIFGLDTCQIDSLSLRFGNAVQKTNEQDGEMTVNMTSLDMQNLVMDGFFVRPKRAP